MDNSVRGLQSPAGRIAARGRYTLVRLDPDSKYQGGELIAIDTVLERPPILTGVVVSSGEGRWAKYVNGELIAWPGGSVFQRTPYKPGDRVTLCRGEGYQKWEEDEVIDGVPTKVEYRIVETFDQLLGFVLEGEATNVRMKLACQRGIMD